MPLRVFGIVERKRKVCIKKIQWGGELVTVFWFRFLWKSFETAKTSKDCIFQHAYIATECDTRSKFTVSLLKLS